MYVFSHMYSLIQIRAIQANSMCMCVKNVIDIMPLVAMGLAMHRPSPFPPPDNSGVVLIHHTYHIWLAKDSNR